MVNLVLLLKTLNMDKVNKVLEVMKNAGKPLKNSEITELTGLGKSDIDKVMKQLKDEGKIISPKRCFWKPK